jgi:hypothetical protein
MLPYLANKTFATICKEELFGLILGVEYDSYCTYLRIIINRRWPDMISNENLWDVTNQKAIVNQIKQRKWCWTGHTLRKTEGAIERAALDRNPQGASRRGRPRKTWKKTVEEEAAVMGKTWKEVKRLKIAVFWVVAPCSLVEVYQRDDGGSKDL